MEIAVSLIEARQFFVRVLWKLSTDPFFTIRGVAGLRQGASGIYEIISACGGGEIVS